MKSTGIIRTIDDLGRIVIPKEIRRTMRLHEGDPLELLVSNEDIVLRKYSHVKSISKHAQKCSDVIYGISEMPVIISDQDSIIAASGVSKRECLDRRVSLELEEQMNTRRQYNASWNSDKELHPVEGVDCSAAVVCPVLAQQVVVGAVVLLKREGFQHPTDAELSLAKAGAAFLGKLLDE